MSQDKLCDLRRLGIVAKGYLQVHVNGRLQRFPAVTHKGQLYIVTMMKVGLNVALKIIITNMMISSHYESTCFMKASALFFHDNLS